MRKLLSHIKPLEEHYLLDYLSCFEKPLGIAIEGMRNNYSSLFYAYLKFLLSYNTKFNEINSLFGVFEIILPKVGFSLNKIEVSSSGNIHKIIKEEINCNHPVFIKGNQKEIPYSIYYKEENWPHLYLVSGYDEEKQIYFIIDGTQNKKNIHFYDEFVIDFKTLESTSSSYNKIYNSKWIYSIELVGNNIHQLYFVYDYFEFITRNIVNQPFIELDIMRSCIESDLLSNDQIYSSNMKLLQIVKHKEVLFKETINLLENIPISNRNILRLKEISEILIASWKQANLSFILCLHRNKKTDIEKSTLSSTLNEITIRDLLFEIKNEISVLIKKHSPINIFDNNMRWNIENNKDLIVEIKENDCIEFNFNNSKVYNSWVNDESPKAYLKGEKIYNENFNFNTTLIFDNFDNYVFFHAGIVFRTTRGKLYFWGVHCSNTVFLSKIGDNTPYGLTKINTNRVSLSVRKIGEEYEFGLTYEKNKIIQILPLNDDGELFSIGVGCKTWEEARRLNIEFSNIDFSLGNCIEYATK